MRLITLSGNTGAGKSTLGRAMSERLSSQTAFKYIDEKSLHHPSLARMFEDPARWGLPIQMNFTVQRSTAILRSQETMPDGIVLMERSLSEDRIFFSRLVDHGFIPKSLVEPYFTLLDELEHRCVSPRHIYLATPPNQCIERLEQARLTGSREVELPPTPLAEYVRELGDRYESWWSAVAHDGSHLRVEPGLKPGAVLADQVEAWLMDCG